MLRTYPLYTAAQVRELDRCAIEQAGIPGYSLMSRAGKTVREWLRNCWPQAHSLLVLCGTGNNGGDGYVIARLALEAGDAVQLMQLGDAESITGDALMAREAWLAAGGKVEAFVAEIPGHVELIIDAMLGTGLERPLADDWLTAVQLLNDSGKPVVAVDIPSGLHADTGRVQGAAVHADMTVTFIGRKQGLYTGEGPAVSGKVVFDDLQVPAPVYQSMLVLAELVTGVSSLPSVLQRSRTAHKGDHGHVLIIGGEAGMSGAAQLAGLAALRCGAGLVSIATRSAHAALISAACPELMCHGIDDARELKPLLSRATVVAIGPGLGRSAWSQQLLAMVLQAKLPLIVDADALNLLALDPISRENWIITPHPGEAARLLAQSVTDIQHDRFASVRALVDRYGGSVVLKGAGSLVCTADRPIAVCTAGNPGMATAGMGDVLSGVIAALVAQRLALPDAARLAVCVHGQAGDRAAAGGERGLLARDVIAELRQVMNVQAGPV
ncbi:MAG: NAD(P)H-hydrate dehydratase [Pseudomonadota bacterium]